MKKSEHLKEALKYCEDINSGMIPSGQYCKKAVKRFMNDVKRQKDADFLYTFMPEKAEEVIDFAESLTIPDIHTEDKKLRLLPWHKFVYYQLFGWVHKLDTERRRFRSGYIEVARKNSKTTSLLFPLILYDFLVTDAAESYFVAKDGLQAEKSFRELKQIIKATPALDEVCRDTSFTITMKSSRIAFFSSESSGVDGYKNSLSVIDEYHAYEVDKVTTSFRMGGRVRLNMLLLIITSAGLDLSGPCYAENEKARKLLNGILTDETYFTLIYAYNDNDDWKNKNNFVKANPSLGPILKEDILVNDLQDAINTPSHQADFKAKTCGIWQSGTSSWIPQQVIDRMRPDTPVDFNLFHHMTGYMGFDLSSTHDFTAVTLCFKKDDRYYFKHRFYIPGETIEERYRKENIGIISWVEQGMVTALPGPTIDEDFIFRDILEDAERFDIKIVTYDAWHAWALIKNIEHQLPHIAHVAFPQDIKKMSEPTKRFEKLLLENKIVDGNPVLNWMLGNANIYVDPNNNIKVVKEYKSSTRRVDGVISSIMALNQCYENEQNTPCGDFNEILMLFK
jgi:phage terminase large subunit-like protein